MPPGYSSRDDRCGIVRVAAQRHVCDGISGAAYWAASVRHGPPWPLPVNAPKSIFQNSNRIQGRELSGLPSSLWNQAQAVHSAAYGG